MTFLARLKRRQVPAVLLLVILVIAYAVRRALQPTVRMYSRSFILAATPRSLLAPFLAIQRLWQQIAPETVL
jgi:hypothetical protein